MKPSPFWRANSIDGQPSTAVELIPDSTFSIFWWMFTSLSMKREPFRRVKCSAIKIWLETKFEKFIRSSQFYQLHSLLKTFDMLKLLFSLCFVALVAATRENKSFYYFSYKELEFSFFFNQLSVMIRPVQVALLEGQTLVPTNFPTWHRSEPIAFICVVELWSAQDGFYQQLTARELFRLLHHQLLLDL